MIARGATQGTNHSRAMAFRWRRNSNNIIKSWISVDRWFAFSIIGLFYRVPICLLAGDTQTPPCRESTDSRYRQILPTYVRDLFSFRFKIWLGFILNASLWKSTWFSPFLKAIFLHCWPEFISWLSHKIEQTPFVALQCARESADAASCQLLFVTVQLEKSNEIDTLLLSSQICAQKFQIYKSARPENDILNNSGGVVVRGLASVSPRRNLHRASCTLRVIFGHQF